MIESKSGSRPHLVTAGKGNKFSCDGECINYKAFGTCSHVVAVANITDLLPAFLDTFQKQKKAPNLNKFSHGRYPEVEDIMVESHHVKEPELIILKLESHLIL